MFGVRMRIGAIHLTIALMIGWFMLPLNSLGVIKTTKNKYSVVSRSNGGYSIKINNSTRYWKFITAEGFFPKTTSNFNIVLIGKGEDWSFRGEKGFYYSLNNIQADEKYCDIGYAWVDAKRELIYLNFFWISSPDKLVASKINGRYKITTIDKK